MQIQWLRVERNRGVPRESHFLSQRKKSRRGDHPAQQGLGSLNEDSVFNELKWLMGAPFRFGRAMSQTKPLSQRTAGFLLFQWLEIHRFLHRHLFGTFSTMQDLSGKNELGTIETNLKKQTELLQEPNPIKEDFAASIVRDTF